MDERLQYWVGEIEYQIKNFGEFLAENIKGYRLTRKRLKKVGTDVSEADETVSKLTCKLKEIHLII